MACGTIRFCGGHRVSEWVNASHIGNIILYFCSVPSKLSSSLRLYSDLLLRSRVRCGLSERVDETKNEKRCERVSVKGPTRRREREGERESRREIEREKCGELHIKCHNIEAKNAYEISAQSSKSKWRRSTDSVYAEHNKTRTIKSINPINIIRVIKN